MKKLKNCYLVIGRSGTGKSTLVKAICDRTGAIEALSYTERPKRPTDDIDCTHIFLTSEEFDRLENFVGYTVYNGNRYGLTEEAFNDSDIYIIDIEGAIYLLKNYNRKYKVIIIGLTANPLEIKSRLNNRDGNSDRFDKDSILFSDDRMNLICDEFIDTSESLENSIEQFEKILKKYE